MMSTTVPRKRLVQRESAMDVCEKLTWQIVDVKNAMPTDDKDTSKAKAKAALISWWKTRQLREKKDRSSRPIRWDEMALEKIPGCDETGQKRIKEFFESDLKRAICIYPEMIAVLFWSWGRKRRTIRIYGVTFPRFHYSRPRSVLRCKVLKDCLHRQIKADLELVDRKRLAPVNPSPRAFENYNLPPPKITWMADGMKTVEAIKLFMENAFFLVTPDRTGKHRPYDGSESIEFRPDEAPMYENWLKRFFVCSGTMYGLEEKDLENEGESVEAMEAMAIETDLTDPQSREIDFKARQLVLLYILRTQMRCRRRLLKDANPDQGSLPATRRLTSAATRKARSALSETVSTLEDRAMLEKIYHSMLQALGAQFEARCRYVFASEGARYRLCVHNGSQFVPMPNSCHGVRDDIDTLLDTEETPTETGRRVLVGKVNRQTGGIIRCHTGKATRLAEEAAIRKGGDERDKEEIVDNLVYLKNPDQASSRWLSRFVEGTSCSVRYDTDLNEYVLAQEGIESGLKRLSAREKRPNSQAFTETSAFLATTCSGLDQVQVLLGGVPVAFFLLCEQKALQSAGRSLVGIIERVLRDPKFPRDDLLYLGKPEGHLSASDVVAKTWNGFHFCVLIIPCVVMSSASAMERTARLVKAAIERGEVDELPDELRGRLSKSIYPSDESAFHGLCQDNGSCYDPGFTFPYLGSASSFPHEIHPSLLRFHAEKYLDESGPTKALPEDAEDTYAFPRTIAEKRSWDLCETRRFLHCYSVPSNYAIPSKFMVVPAEELDHSRLLLPRADGDEDDEGDDATCSFGSEYTNRCTTCSRNNLAASDDDPSTKLGIISYGEVPHWMFGRALMSTRRLARFLDSRHDGEATAADLDRYLAEEMGLGSIWTETVLGTMEASIRSLRGAMIEANFNYSALAEDMDRARMLVNQEILVGVDRPGASETTTFTPTTAPIQTNPDTEIPTSAPLFSVLPSFTEQQKDRIKKYIALAPENFYSKYLGNSFVRMPQTIRWGNKNEICVTLVAKVVTSRSTGENVTVQPGSYIDYKTDSYGDVFDFVMDHRYHSKDKSKCFVATIAHCCQYVLDVYGMDALDVDPAARADLPGAAILGAIGVRDEFRSAMDRVKKARLLWANARPLSTDPREGTIVAVDYMRSRRIWDDRFRGPSSGLRFAEVYPLVDRGERLQYPAVVACLADPRRIPSGGDSNNNTSQGIMGVHGVFMDETLRGKVNTLDIQKKTRGVWVNNAVPVVRPPGGCRKRMDESSPLPGYSTVAIGEGWESMASVAVSCPELCEVWACLGLSNIGNFPYLGGTEPGMPIVYCADNDGLEDRKRFKVEKQVRKLTDKGYSVYLCISDEALTDPNDVLTRAKTPEEGKAALRSRIGAATLYPHTYTPPREPPPKKPRHADAEEQPPDEIMIESSNDDEDEGGSLVGISTTIQGRIGKRRMINPDQGSSVPEQQEDDEPKRRRLKRVQEQADDEDDPFANSDLP